MLSSVLLFLHLSGLAVWLGAAVLLTILFAVLKKQSDNSLLLLCTKLVNRLLSVAALTVLISGGGLIELLGWRGMDKPFWLSFMEQAGGTVILLFIALFTWQSRRLVKRLKQSKEQGQASKIAGWYAGAMGIFTVAITGVLLVVSLRLA